MCIRDRSSPSDEEIAPLNGTVLLIDNDDDDEYEYVSIESKEYFSIDRIKMCIRDRSRLSSH